MHEGIQWHPVATVLKYSPDQVRYAEVLAGSRHVRGDLLAELFPGGPEEGTVTVAGNSLTVAGQLNIARLIAGDPQGLPLFPTAGGRTRSVFGVGADQSPNPEDAPLTIATLSPVQGEAPHGTWYQGMDPQYPQVEAPNMVTGQVTVGRDYACFDWNEWCWAAAAAVAKSGGPHLKQVAEESVMMNRKVASFGVKAPERAWVLRCTVYVR